MSLFALKNVTLLLSWKVMFDRPLKKIVIDNPSQLFCALLGQYKMWIYIYSGEMFFKERYSSFPGQLRLPFIITGR